MNSENLPSIEDMYDAQENFEYRLVPLRKDVPDISRRTRPGDNPTNGNGDETVEATYFQYPFDTFPPVISGAKPHFVVRYWQKAGLAL
ncbi:hypothetical protein HETIRDRAFT_455735 [Heterobasidion irregulare TC 32-1]|uniref:Uncharacterized protein n=1 Tax=Heterobasidion irregulare (strain TC 32-1) TaxID=747525 RepID=W4JRV0_HETIT|nr:uncharacterized protein HETIRDRAFT_455735 [Heterobasidion irregulare TC 32-1]ETW76199.1 hypothetical protein HETIRDRAFT_455735 [Heterobasidion irregulare TC 32-1]